MKKICFACNIPSRGGDIVAWEGEEVTDQAMARIADECAYSFSVIMRDVTQDEKAACVDQYDLRLTQYKEGLISFGELVAAMGGIRP